MIFSFNLLLSTSHTGQSSIFDSSRHFLAFLNIPLSFIAQLRVRIFVDKPIAFVFRILVTLQLLGLNTLLGQLKLALHHQRGEIFPTRGVRVIFECVLRRYDASLVVVAAKTAIAKIGSKVVVQSGRVQFFLHQLVLQLKQSMLRFIFKSRSGIISRYS